MLLSCHLMSLRFTSLTTQSVELGVGFLDGFEMLIRDSEVAVTARRGSKWNKQLIAVI